MHIGYLYDIYIQQIHIKQIKTQKIYKYVQQIPVVQNL